MIKFLIKLVIATASLALFFAVFLPIGTLALSSELPHYDTSNPPPGGADFTDNTYMYVSSTSYVSIPKAAVKFYFTSTGTKTITIHHPHMCYGSTYIDEAAGSTGSVDTRFRFYHTTESASLTEVRTGSAIAVFDGEVRSSGSCTATRNVSVNVTAADESDYVEGRYVIILEIEKLGDDGKNGFKFTANGSGTITSFVSSNAVNYSDTSGLGILGSSGEYGSFYLKFGADCRVTSSAGEWFAIALDDPDNGEPGVQPSPFDFRIYDHTAGDWVSDSNYSFTEGPSTPIPTENRMVNLADDYWRPPNYGSANYANNREYRVNIRVFPNHKYSWRLYGIYDNNLMEVKSPFDSIYFADSCPSNRFRFTPLLQTPVLNPDNEDSSTVRFEADLRLSVANVTDGLARATVTRSYYILRPDGSTLPFGTPTTRGYDNNDPPWPEGTHAYGTDTETIPSAERVPGNRVCQRMTIALSGSGSIYHSDWDPGTGVSNGIGDILERGPNLTTELEASCARIVNMPYLKVFGGGVSAGAAFIDPALNECDASAFGGGEISTHARGATPGAIIGSSSQYAAIAAEAIGGGSPVYGFYSASNRGNSGGYLTFANYNGTASTFTPPTAWGGEFSPGSGRCLTDFYDETGQYTRFVTPPQNLGASPTVDLSDLVSGTQYQASGDVTLNGQAVPNGIDGNEGKRVTLYVDGNLKIASDITYSGNYTIWSTKPFRTSVPFVTFIVRGNIFIERDVNNLAGVYIAQPSASDPDNSGQIFTCAALTTFTQISLPNRFDLCHGPVTTTNIETSSCNGGFDDPATSGIAYNRGGPLAIHGAFIAKKVHFDRSNGTLRCGIVSEAFSNNRAAEKFYYAPEMFLGRPLIRSRTGSSDDDFGTADSYTTLPPIF